MQDHKPAWQYGTSTNEVWQCGTSTNEVWPITIGFLMPDSNEWVQENVDVIIKYYNISPTESIIDDMKARDGVTDVHVLNICHYSHAIVCSRGRNITIEDHYCTIYPGLIVDVTNMDVYGSAIKPPSQRGLFIYTVSDITFEFKSNIDGVETYYVGSNFNWTKNHTYVRKCNFQTKPMCTNVGSHAGCLDLHLGWNLTDVRGLIHKQLDYVFEKYRDNLVRQFRAQYCEEVAAEVTKLILFDAAMPGPRDVITYIAGYLRELTPRPMIE